MEEKTTGGLAKDKWCDTAMFPNPTGGRVSFVESWWEVMLYVLDVLQCRSDDRKKNVRKRLIISNKSMHLFDIKKNKQKKKTQEILFVQCFQCHSCLFRCCFIPTLFKFWVFFCFCFFGHFCYASILKKKNNWNSALFVLCFVHIILRQSLSALVCDSLSCVSVTSWSLSDSTQTFQLQKKKKKKRRS